MQFLRIAIAAFFSGVLASPVPELSKAADSWMNYTVVLYSAPNFKGINVTIPTTWPPSDNVNCISLSPFKNGGFQSIDMIDNNWDCLLYPADDCTTPGLKHVEPAYINHPNSNLKLTLEETDTLTYPKSIKCWNQKAYYCYYVPGGCPV